MAGMTRDPEQLTARPFDLLVVGGGIHGLFAAYDAALRGWAVALVDRGDFGGGISFNHQRTLHGGLRALQSGQVRKCLEQIRERRAWAAIAPHLVRPLPFLIGTYRGTRRSRLLVRAGFRVYDSLGRRRNLGVLPELHLPKGRMESAAATRRLFRGINEPGLSGGAIWYDYQTVHPDRLTWCVALAAADAGAQLVNYTDAVALHRDGGRVTGVDVRDTLNGKTRTVQASHVLLAAGAGLASLHDAWGLAPPPPLVRAANLLLDRPARDIAVAAPSRRGAMYTAVPWREHVLVGTYQSPTVVSAIHPSLTEEDLDVFLADVGSAFPALEADRAAVRFVHSACVPARVQGGRVDLLPESQLLRHQGTDGLLSLVGVKYTTARLSAERAIDLLGAPAGRRQTGRRVLPHADVADSDGLLQEVLRRHRLGLDRDVMRHLASWYGTEGAAVVNDAAESGHLTRLSSTTPVLAGEVVHAVRHGAVVRLADVVFRRTPLASAGDPGPEALDRAAALTGDLLGWTPERRAEELALVRARLTGFETR